MKSVLAATILGTAMMTTAFAQAAPETNHSGAHSGVLSLDAQAVAEVPTDTVTLTLGAEQEGADPGAISTALSRKADDVISQAKRTSGVQAETGGFNIYPNTDRNGKISVWRGRAEVRITSKDFAAASKLAGQLANQMQVQNVNFTLSREARTAAEAKLIDQAVSAFRDKALATTKLFGYTSYTIRDVHVSEGSNNPGPRPMMARMAAAPASFDSAPVPIEGGKAQVTVTVSGAVQMLK
ncbi:SIMPL domain-containing protein [Ralstonia sp. R-29]|uniref:SIMPL domain-containing protein n=1 Tax=Ralstonia sp. R-29 TaxID=3404059 RepID=UPI003CEE38D6